jgi:MFS transporter, PPP family, 3-phenylpropionic acid transporter
VLAPLLVSEVKKRPRPERYLQWALALGAVAYLLLGQQDSFLPILVIVFFQALVMAGLVPLSDSMAVSVANASAGTGYGGVRVWSSVGWILSVLSAGWLIERFGFAAGFGGVAFGFLAGRFADFFYPPEATFPARKHTTEQPKSDLRATLGTRQARPDFAGFCVALVFIGFLNNGVFQFENVYLSELGASKTLISVAGILSAVVELPFMLWADKIMRRVSAPRLMLLAFVIIIFQRLLVLAFPSIASIMIARFIGGTSFSFYTVAFIGLISSRTQPMKPARCWRCIPSPFQAWSVCWPRRFRGDFRCCWRALAVCPFVAWLQHRPGQPGPGRSQRFKRNLMQTIPS